jgi:hypothetical protein
VVSTLCKPVDDCLESITLAAAMPCVSGGFLRRFVRRSLWLRGHGAVGLKCRGFEGGESDLNPYVISLRRQARPTEHEVQAAVP